MAEKERTKITDSSPEELLRGFHVEGINRARIASGKKNNLKPSQKLTEAEERIAAAAPDNAEHESQETVFLKASKKITGDVILIGTIPFDINRFKENFNAVKNSYLTGNTVKRETALEKLVLLGQELLRRKYLTKIMETEKTIKTSAGFDLIVEWGSAAIQVLGKAPAHPRYGFKKFSSKYAPQTKFTGIEILSSGAFPDWTENTNRYLRSSKKVLAAGFENVIEAAFDSPRSRVIARAFGEGKIKNISSLPLYMRTMLDLELMRLGQATTPGTFRMLLNSYYYGAMLVDHSTNVSEQVQIIYAEENWKPVYVIDKRKANDQIENAEGLLREFFVTKANSPIKKDHPRTARIEFSQDADLKIVKTFFNELKKLVKQIKLNGIVHEIQPTVRLTGFAGRAAYVKLAIKILWAAGYKKLAVTADYIKHYPGLLQYFNSAEETNDVISFAKRNKVTLIDGRTVDMIATSNKAIEAAAGAIMSGHGCIKVGLLGLTYEQMLDFIKKFKDGIGANYKRQSNQVIVFIGLVDEPLVTDEKVLTDAKQISEKFIELMRTRRHDILLLDTMHKGKDDKRFVSEKDLNKEDTKGGHLSFKELTKLVKKSNKGAGIYGGCDLWVAGSYTEEQVYQASGAPANERPGLICLGGAERSFGGIRLDPKDAYEISPNSRNKPEKELAALIQFDSDVKFLLSRDNKLARDAGLVEGELRRKKKKEARELKKMREEYKEIRKKYYSSLAEHAMRRKVSSKNIDTLVNLGKLNSQNISALRKKFLQQRNKYVNKVADLMYELYKNQWF